MIHGQVWGARVHPAAGSAFLNRKALRNLLVLVLHHPELVASPDEQEEDVKEEEDAEDVENPEEDSSWVLEVRVFGACFLPSCQLKLVATSDTVTLLLVATCGNCYYHLGY